MPHSKLIRFVLTVVFTATFVALSQSREIVVSQDGGGDFATIAEAVDSLGMYNYQRVVIMVRDGVYEEKVAVRQDYVTIRGESRDKTILRMDLPRSLYLENPDAIGPAILNIYGDDFILENLTIENTQPVKKTHAFAVYGEGTRTILQDCNLWSNGGDTVSLWNYKEGMYYHARCDFRGGVDFVCPRGWCYIEDSTFYTTYDTAAIWHAGPHTKEQKFVLKNCEFDGAEEFDLGRHHYEAQFYLIDCRFSEKVSDRPIYFVSYDDPSRNRPFVWGPRYRFHNAQGEGRHDWMVDNINVDELKEITPAWTFDGAWNPLDTSGPKLIAIRTVESGVVFDFKEPVSVSGKPVIETKSGEKLTYSDGAGSSSLYFEGNRIENLDLEKISDGKITGNTARSSSSSWKL